MFQTFQKLVLPEGLRVVREPRDSRLQKRQQAVEALRELLPGDRARVRRTPRDPKIIGANTFKNGTRFGIIKFPSS